MCPYTGGTKKACWEFVQEDAACSFHICIDCLVYLAKHEDSTLTEEEFSAIMRQREKDLYTRIIFCNYETQREKPSQGI